MDASMPVGSVSKQFCAACILFLCEQKVLSVDDTLDKFYPNDKINKNLTVKHLLNMSSGFRNYLDYVDQSMVGENEWDNVNTITREIFKQDPGFEPGEDYEYSNSNYFLLANIVEKASGIAYHKFLREQFFEPLEMKHTGFVDDIQKDEKLASALSVEDLKKEYFYCPGVTKGAGDVVSNAEDMDKWMRGLSTGKILSTEGFRQMAETVNPESTEEYGYGLWHMPYDGVGHVGQIPPSFGAVDYINTGRDVYLFAMSNSGRGMSYVQEITQALLSVLFEEKS
jgi:CubicO group peptidase (beta-lactamase class C family)